MNSVQRIGGIAALIMATTYLVGFAVFFMVLNPGGPLDPVEKVAFLAENELVTYITMLFLYVVGGFSLIVLVRALYERMKVEAPALMLTTAVLGFIWCGVVIAAGMIYIIGMDTVIDLFENDSAQASSVWLTVQIVFEGLGGGTEIIGGVWSLLISWTALQQRQFPKTACYLGLVVGVAGVITIVPALEDFTAIFGLGQIPWFICLGFVLLQDKTSATAST